MIWTWQEGILVVTGWAYALCWAVAYYPQVYKNWKRKSVVGFSTDFVILNLFGYGMYVIFNSCMFWSKEVQSEYYESHHTHQLPVLINDVLIAFHNFTLTGIQLIQIIMYRARGNNPSKICIGVLTLWFGIITLLIVLRVAHVFNWLVLVTALGYFKMIASASKYIPQALVNFRMKAVIGFSMEYVFLDLSGAILSMVQMVVLFAITQSSSAISGNLPKFTLAIVAGSFSILYIIQRYVLYKHNSEKGLPPPPPVQTNYTSETDEIEPLLSVLSNVESIKISSV
jgi:LCT (Lysosomal Cystine Transporter) family transporter